MPRKRQSAADDLMELVAMLPWWAGVALALVAYIVLHRMAEAPIAIPTQAGQMGTAVAGNMGKGLAMVGQYLLPLICLAGAAASAITRAKRRRLLEEVTANPAADALNGMSWQEFEMLVGEAFRRQGFSVAETGGGGPDGGIDLMLNKGNERFVVQCKQWKALKVGVTTVRELYGVMAASGATGGYIVTSGQFTPDAQEFAAGRNITLMDGPALRKFISGIQVSPPTSQTTTPLCPKCGSSMVKRTAKQGSNAGQDFWGCAKYPACRGTRNI